MQNRTKNELLDEIRNLQQRVKELEKPERMKPGKAHITGEDTFKSLVDSIPELIFMIDSNNKVIFVNNSAAHILNREPEEIMGESIFQIFNKDIAERYSKDLEHVFKTKNPLNKELSSYMGGRTLWLNVSLAPVIKADEVTAVVGISRDITKRKQAEEELRENELRYRRAQEIGHVGNWEYNVQTTNFWGSEEAKRIYGFDPDKDVFTTDEVENCIPDRENVHHSLVDLIEQGKPYDIEFEIITKNTGESKFIHSQAVLEKDDSGNSLKVTGVVRDITASRFAEEKLRESEEKFRVIIENISELVVKVDTEGRLLFVNPAYCKMFGKTENELLGEKFMPLIHKDDLDNTLTAMEKLYKPPYTCHLEQRAKTKEGWKWLSWSDTAILDEKNDVIAIIGVGSDITDQKKAEQKIRYYYRQLKKLIAHLEKVREEEQKRIARELHDELGQALTAMKLELAGYQADLPDQPSNKMKELETINNLLNLTISTTRKLITELRPGILDDLGLASAIRWQLAHFEDRTKIKYKLTVLEEEPLNQDIATAFFRILQESLTNVARHSEATRVKVSLKSQDQYYVLTVSDNGIGISNNKSTDFISFGLLGIQERAEQHGGTLQIKGIENRGTTLKISIPVPGTNS